MMTAAIVFATATVFGQNIDKVNSKINFEVSNMVVNTVEGSFSGMTGEINFSSTKLAKASLNVCIDAATVNTENEKRDAHLKNEDFFHVDMYPTICFNSTEITKSGSDYLVKGKLNMHGVEKMIEIPFTYVSGEFSGNLTLNRLDYKIGEGTNTAMVGDEITIQIVCKTENIKS